MRSTFVSALLLMLMACGSSESESPDTASPAGGEEPVADEAGVEAESAVVAEGEHHPDTRWPDAPSADARFHVILHPVDINADNVEPDAVANINQFFIDHIQQEAPEVHVAPPGSSVPDGMLGYVLEPAIEVVEDQADRCHVEVQLILMTHDDDLRADIPTSAAAMEGEGHHRQRHAVQGAFAGGLTLLRQALEAAERRDSM